MKNGDSANPTVPLMSLRPRTVTARLTRTLVIHIFIPALVGVVQQPQSPPRSFISAAAANANSTLSCPPGFVPIFGFPFQKDEIRLLRPARTLQTLRAEGTLNPPVGVADDVGT